MPDPQTRSGPQNPDSKLGRAHESQKDAADCNQLSPFLLLLANDVFEFGLVLDFAAGTRLGVYDAGGFGLADARTGVGFDGFGNRKSGWLAFRHGKDEYGID